MRTPPPIAPLRRRVFLQALLLLGVGVPVLTRTPVGAAMPALRIDLNQAIQAASHSFDPRSDTQWGARNKPMPGGEQPWMARHAFNAERIRSILTEVYYRGPQRLGNSGGALLVIDAGRSKGVVEIDLMVSKAAFVELQRTLKAPPSVRLLFPEPQDFKEEFRVSVRFENR
jgi:hypothetical protein